jgi:hypothetical protein
MTKNPNIIRVGDRVRIVNPQVFIRCGYPKSLDQSIKEVEEKYNEVLTKFMKELGLSVFSSRLPHTDRILSRVYEQVRLAVAYAKLREEKFGGKQRSVHTENRPELAGVTRFVMGIFYVKSGVYCPGSCYGGYGWEEDYDPPVLDEQKTHKILRLSFMPEICIEATNVVKITKENDEEFSSALEE